MMPAYWDRWEGNRKPWQQVLLTADLAAAGQCDLTNKNFYVHMLSTYVNDRSVVLAIVLLF